MKLKTKILRSVYRRKRQSPWAQKAMSLTELMVIILVVSVIAGFGIPSYTRAMERVHVRDAMVQLTSIWAANKDLFFEIGAYWPYDNDEPVGNLERINTMFNLAIVPNGMVYSCEGGKFAYVCSAQRNWSQGAYTVSVNEDPINSTQDAGADNPFCTGACP